MSKKDKIKEFKELFMRNPAEIEGAKRVEWRQLAEDRVEQAIQFLISYGEAQYRRGQYDAFNGKIKNLSHITIDETIKVPKMIQGFFIKKGKSEMLDFISEGIKNIPTESCTLGLDAYEGDYIRDLLKKAHDL